MFVCCECCVLSGRGLCDELITRPKESYRLWWVVCDLENLKNEEAMTRVGSQRHRKKKPLRPRSRPANTRRCVVWSRFWGHLHSGPCTLKLKAGDSFQVLAPRVELREVTYQKITICIQTAVRPANLSSTHSSEIPCCYDNRQFDFVNTMARSRDSSDGTQTRL